MEKDNIKKKRVRDNDSVATQAETKLARVSSENSVVTSTELHQVDSDDSVVNSPVVKLAQDEILSILDDAETEPTIQGLDSVIRSFEEEILVSPAAICSGESFTELGYLLEASDDELGLPPSFSSGDDGRLTSPGIEGLKGVTTLGYESELPSYDSFELVGDSAGSMIDNSINGDLFTLGDELFDLTGESFTDSSSSSLLW
ncbi:hypothetical protein ACFE04_009557 [Oxalis oulophora]